MGEVCAFVDVGYLKAEGARTLGKRPAATTLAAGALVNFLRTPGPGGVGHDALLRVYWYDAAFDPADTRYQSQRKYFGAVAATPGVHLRLGHLQEIMPSWQHAVRKALEACNYDVDAFQQHFQFRPELRQKGVDTLLTLDLVRLAQGRVYDTAFLFAGDRDLSEAVRLAQDAGRRVKLLVPDAGGLATGLRDLADDVVTLSAGELSQFLK